MWIKTLRAPFSPAARKAVSASSRVNSAPNMGRMWIDRSTRASIAFENGPQREPITRTSSMTIGGQVGGVGPGHGRLEHDRAEGPDQPQGSGQAGRRAGAVGHDVERTRERGGLVERVGRDPF